MCRTERRSRFWGHLAIWCPRTYPLHLIAGQQRHLHVIAGQVVQTSRSETLSRCICKRDPAPRWVGDRIHQLIVPVNRAIIGHGVGAGAVDAVEKTFVDGFTTFSLGFVHGETHEVVPQTLNSLSGKDAKDVSLWVSEFSRGVATEPRDVLPEESLHSGERQMGEPGTVVEQRGDALDRGQKQGTRIHRSYLPSRSG